MRFVDKRFVERLPAEQPHVSPTRLAIGEQDDGAASPSGEGFQRVELGGGQLFGRANNREVEGIQRLCRERHRRGARSNLEATGGAHPGDDVEVWIRLEDTADKS